MNRSLCIAAVAFCATALPTLASAQFTPAPAPPIAGISCDAQEGQRIHIHQHLVILDHGKTVPIPPNIGQRIAQRCLYWVHTHTPDGIIHIEAPQDRTFTLGDFFSVWDQPLTKTQVAAAHADKSTAIKFWVDGVMFTGDPRTIKLKPHTDIVVQVGPPYGKPALFTTWGTL